MENEELLNGLLDELRTLNATQKDISHSLQVLARSMTEKRLAHIFDNPDELLVFQLSDGEKSTSDLAEYIGASKMKISRLWKKWEEDFGIVESMGSKNHIVPNILWKS